MSLRMWTLGLVVLGVTALAPYPARAGQLRCVSHDLPSDEKREAFEAARQVIPKDAGRFTLESTCWNSESALAWFRTPTVVDEDGVRWWWSAQCRRETRPWSCEAAIKERRIDVSVAAIGAPARIQARLPVGFPADRARSIVATSARLSGQREMPLPACPPDPDDAANWNRLRSYTATLASEDGYADIERSNTGADVE